MSHPPRLFALGLVLALSTAAVGQPPKKEPAPSAEFALKWTKDIPVYSKLTTKTAQVVKVQGLEVEQNQAQTFYFKWLPLAEKNGEWTVRQSVEGAVMVIDIAGSVVKYDSTRDPPGAGTNAAMDKVFAALVGLELDVTFARDGTPKRVAGREAFVEKLTAVDNKVLAPLLEKILGEDAVREMCDLTFGLRSEAGGGRRVNDVWELKKTLNLGPLGSYQSKYEYRLDKVDGDVAVVSVTPTVTYKPPADNKTDAPLPFKVKGGELGTDGKPVPGVIKFDLRKGRILSAESTLKVRGKLEIEIADKLTETEIKQEQTTKLEFADKSLLPAKK